MFKVCPICGKEFETMSSARKYCGVECTKKKEKVRWTYKNSRKREEKKRKRKSAASVPSDGTTIQDVLAFSKINHVSYGKAVAMMEATR